MHDLTVEDQRREVVMSEELDDVARAFSGLQEATKDLKDENTKVAIHRAIDSLLMAIGAIELRLNLLEMRGTAQSVRSRRTSVTPKGRHTAA
jgi:hypothetical protein